VPNGLLPNAEAAGEDPKLKDGVLEAPNAPVFAAPNAGVLEAPNEEELEAPNADVLDPKTGELETPKAPPVLPNGELTVDPKAGVLAAPNAGVIVAPNAGVLGVPNAGWLDEPKGVEDPNRLLPKAGCDCWKELPNGLVWAVPDPKAPKVGFWPKTDVPKAGVDEAPNAGVDVPNAGDDEAPKTDVEPKGDELVLPNTPVEVLPKNELPVCAPKGVVPPNGLGAKGLPPALAFCPKPDCDPNGLPDDCPKGLEPNIFNNSSIQSNPIQDSKAQPWKLV
jgi:hypothetical protein